MQSTFGRDAGGYTPVWDANPPGRFASVNAGDPGLYVGGGGVNLAFARSFGNSTFFEALHGKAVEAAGTDGKLHKVEIPQELKSKVLHCFVKAVPSLGSVTGICIIDVLAPGLRPLSDKNVAMVYVVGPRGKTFKANEFLHAVEVTAANMMQAVNEYNNLVPDLSIQFMRVCLVSGGIFKHKDVTKEEVAGAIIKGLSDNYTEGVSCKIDFAYDQDAFRRAMTQSRLC
eukprot:Blabericola_migrator_1__7705@NODE_3931_length_1420_cov_121_954915_g2432_i0_p1_GENE_NODE_3931_length_1420_cov_121_954915_g2432_i0NODE_3931_length_1420_cov_121_954915_g2432_i0_p1_ORF_typecomplete_len228_score45_68NMT/PF01233_19/0_11_NODE_3931_length_1420_cov_121_954915_g2432_i0158841